MGLGRGGQHASERWSACAGTGGQYGSEYTRRKRTAKENRSDMVGMPGYVEQHHRYSPQSINIIFISSIIKLFAYIYNKVPAMNIFLKNYDMGLGSENVGSIVQVVH
jgi:hypothetical protein